MKKNQILYENRTTEQAIKEREAEQRYLMKIKEVLATMENNSKKNTRE